MKASYIAIAGTMGSGKTTVARLLAQKLFQSHLIEENFADNQFLPRFYQDMRRWALCSQTFFLLEKIKQTRQVPQLLVKHQLVIQDTPLQQDVLSYAKAQLVMGNMDSAEFELYSKVYTTCADNLAKPDLIIFLDVQLTTIYQRIASRQRQYEHDVPHEYLQILDKLNRHWLKVGKIPVLRVKIDQLDLLTSNSDQDQFISQINQKLS